MAHPTTGGLLGAQPRELLRRRLRLRLVGARALGLLLRLSTLITPREVARFTNSLTALQKAAMVDEMHGGGMKKKDKSAKKKK